MVNKMSEEDTMFIRIAFTVSHRSKATKRKVGAIAVKDGNVIGIGINGTPTGWYTNNDVNPETGKTDEVVLHAEENMIAKIASSTNSSVGSTVYCTCAPCVKCARLLAQSGVERVVYYDDFKNNDGLMLLEMMNIKVDKYKEDSYV